MATSRKHGIIGPMHVQIVSNEGEMCEIGANTSVGQQVFEDDSEGISANSSYNDGDRSLLGEDVEKLIDEVQDQVLSIHESVDTSRKEMKKLTLQDMQSKFSDNFHVYWYQVDVFLTIA